MSKCKNPECKDGKITIQINDYGEPKGEDQRRFLELQNKEIHCPDCTGHPDTAGFVDNRFQMKRKAGGTRGSGHAIDLCHECDTKMCGPTGTRPFLRDGEWWCQKFTDLTKDKTIARLEAELAKHRWIPMSECPKNDTYYIALIGDTGDDFGNTLEWLYFNGMWHYAKDKKHYPRTIFILQYMKISLPCILPEQEASNE